MQKTETAEDLMKEAAWEIKALRQQVALQSAKIEGFEMAYNLLTAYPRSHLNMPESTSADLIWRLEHHGEAERKEREARAQQERLETEVMNPPAPPVMPQEPAELQEIDAGI